jgi:hypothetical protein
LLRLQRQPRLWPSEAVTCSSKEGRQAGGWGG